MDNIQSPLFKFMLPFRTTLLLLIKFGWIKTVNCKYKCLQMWFVSSCIIFVLWISFWTVKLNTYIGCYFEMVYISGLYKKSILVKTVFRWPMLLETFGFILMRKYNPKGLNMLMVLISIICILVIFMLKVSGFINSHQKQY